MNQDAPKEPNSPPIVQGSVDSAPKGLSQNQAADKIKNLLTPPAPTAEEKKPKQSTNQPKANKADGADDVGQPKPKKAPELEANGTKPAEDNQETETTDETEAGAVDDGNEGEGESDEDQVDGDTSDGEDGNGEEETKHIVIVDDKEYEVSYEELVAGYQRQADYTRKSMDLAKEKKQVEAVKAEVADLPERKKEYQQGAERFVKNAALVMNALEHRFMPQPPSIELAKTDPAAYLQQKETYQEALQFRGALQGEIVKLEEMGKAEHQKAVSEGRKKLYDAMPEMNDPASRQKLREYANSLGFSDEQIANEASHALFVCVEKARRWDDLQKSKANLKDKKPMPKVTSRTVTPPTQKAVQQRQKQNVLSTHKSQGTVNSAAEAIKAGIFARK